MINMTPKELETERLKIAQKYGVSSTEDFEEEYKRGNIEEEGTWDDFFRLDHLETEIDSLKITPSSVR